MGINRDPFEDIVELEPVRDAASGEMVFGIPDRLSPADVSALSIREGRLERTVPETPAQPVNLPDERFAGEENGIPWHQTEQAQDRGQEVQIIDGQIVFGQTDSQPGRTIKLTDERFAAPTIESTYREIRVLAESGLASKVVQNLTPTSQLREHFPEDPKGWYLHTRPTSHGDELHVVIAHNPSTGLYHAHLWAFMQMHQGKLKRVDLARWVGTHASLSAHNTHLYPGHGGQGAILCLSPRTQGGMTSLTDAILQSSKWADGMGQVVRGSVFPYRQ